MIIRDIIPAPKFLPPPDTECSLVDSTTYYGIEIETEGARMRRDVLDDQLQYWDVTVDGSLKSSSPFELIFVQPLVGAQIEAALEEFRLISIPAQFKFPLNTGVHFHMNVSDLTLEQVRRLMYISIVCESALIQYSGKKFNNSFCIPVSCVSHELIGRIGNFLSQEAMWDYSDVSSMKYLTINPASIFKLGTIEYRMMAGTGDVEKITDFLNVLGTLRKYAIETELDPRRDLDYLTNPRDMMAFLTDIWGRDVAMKMRHPNLHQHMVASSLAARLGMYPKSGHEFQHWVLRRGTQDYEYTSDKPSFNFNHQTWSTAADELEELS